MKCAIVLAEGIKQIMFTPENDTEKIALKMITADDSIVVEVKEGTFFGNGTPKRVAGYEVRECMGGWMRAYENADSVMLVLKPKKKEMQAESLNE